MTIWADLGRVQRMPTASLGVPKPEPDHGVTDNEYRAWMVAQTAFYLFAQASGREHELAWETASDRVRWHFFRQTELLLRRADDLRTAGQSPSDVVIRQQLAQLKARVLASTTGPIRDEAGRILAARQA